MKRFIKDVSNRENGKTLRSYGVWKNMAKRCYNPLHISYKSYGAKGAKVCEEWFLYSNFKKWYDENHIEGYQLDKDKLSKGEKNI